MLLWCWICYVIFKLGTCITDEDQLLTIRKLSTGTVRGRVLKTSRNTTGYVFLGVPYAKPPLDDLRFRLPEPVETWSGILDAGQYRNSCMWNSSITHNIPEFTVMGEDCLHMNIFTNRHCLSRQNCAVMFYIHGGQYNFDSPMLFPIEFLVDNYAPPDRSVVLVTFAYRLGSLGFLNLSPLIAKTSAPKNVGMYDMIMALKWVQKEIRNFGGDPQRVTITGHSSGAAADEQLSLSPKTAGLFQQVLVMSASLTSQLKLNQNENASRELAIAVGCANRSATLYDNVEHVEQVLSCLRKQDAKFLLSKQRLIETTGPMITMLGPAFDPPDGLWPVAHRVLFKKRRPYTYMIGTLSGEQRDSVAFVTANGQVDKTMLAKFCAQYIRDRYDNWKAATIDCVQYYDDPERVKELSDDVEFYLPTLISANSMVNAGGRTFLYQWEYGNIGQAFSIPYAMDGVPHHTQELVYLMGIHLGNFTERDEKIRFLFSQMIINFIKTGDPSLPLQQPFLPYKSRLSNYFVIDFDEQLKMPGNHLGYHKKAIKFWNQTILKHGGKQKDPFLERSFDSSITLLVSLPENFQFLESINDHRLEANSPAVWHRNFWIAAGIAIILALALFVTCYLFLYNWSKRKMYERLA